jgi:hypothetical protein
MHGMANTTNPDARAASLNALPDSHWHAWYDAERRHSERLDLYLSMCMGVDRAADLAAADMMVKPG